MTSHELAQKLLELSDVEVSADFLRPILPYKVVPIWSDRDIRELNGEIMEYGDGKINCCSD